MPFPVLFPYPSLAYLTQTLTSVLHPQAGGFHETPRALIVQPLASPFRREQRHQRKNLSSGPYFPLMVSVALLSMAALNK